MDLKHHRVQSPEAAMICRTAIACLLLLSGLNSQSTMHTTSLQSTPTTFPISESPYLESSQTSTTTEHSNTVTPSVAVTETFTSKESLAAKTDGTDQTTVSDDNSTTTQSTTSISPTTMNTDLTVTNSTIENGTHINTTIPTSLPTELNDTGTGIEPSTPAVVSGGTLSTNFVEFSSGPVESSTETITNQTDTVTNATGNTSTKTSSGDISSSKTSTQGTAQSAGTQSSLVGSTTTAGNTEPTIPVSKITPVSEFQSLTPKYISTAAAFTESNKELQKALSTGSVAAITIIVIVLVLLIFGGAAFWKIRHSSYGRLLEDQDYGSLGNYNNPLYDDS